MADKPPIAELELLPGSLQHFVVEYDSNGNNGVRAWLASHAGTTSLKAAASSASQALRNPKVKAALDVLTQARWKRLGMGGDEALALIAGDARADIREIFDEHDQILPVKDWPDSIARSVKSVKNGPYGLSVTLNDSLAARKLIAESTGAIRNPLSGVNDLARLLAGNFADDE